MIAKPPCTPCPPPWTDAGYTSRRSPGGCCSGSTRRRPLKRAEAPQTVFGTVARATGRTTRSEGSGSGRGMLAQPAPTIATPAAVPLVVTCAQCREEVLGADLIGDAEEC